MPELPEVETRLLYLRRTAIGQRIERVKVLERRIISCSHARAGGDRCLRRFTRGLSGRQLVEARRRGKYLVVTLDNGRVLILHFGMGGDLVCYKNAADRPDYTRIDLWLSNGWRLAFTCPRNICRVMLVDHIEEVPALKHMGPEPLEQCYTLSHLQQAIGAASRRRIKPLLVDQRKIAGIGNIYADEILFEARVRPDRLAGSLDVRETRRIFSATRRVLKRAIRTAGEPEFPASFLASAARRGEGCRRCGGPIRSMRLAGRRAHFCPGCQR